MKLSCLRQLNNVFTVDISASSLDPTKGKDIYIFDLPKAMMADLLCVFHCVTQEQTQALPGGGGDILYPLPSQEKILGGDLPS